jgi:hypothetical protein
MLLKRKKGNMRNDHLSAGIYRIKNEYIYVCVQLRKNVILRMGYMRQYSNGTFQSFQHFCGG